MRTRILPVIVLMMVCGGASATSAGPIASGYWGGHVYYVFAYAEKSWTDAQADLQANLGPGWYLATITSLEEQAFLSAMMPTPPSPLPPADDHWGRGEYWLGGYQDPSPLPAPGDAAKNWHWVTAETWAYNNWGEGEPNDARVPQNTNGPYNEQYLAMWSETGWRWNDESGLGNISGYVAEAVVPEPASLLLLGTGLVGAVRIWRRRRP